MRQCFFCFLIALILLSLSCSSSKTNNNSTNSNNQQAQANQANVQKGFVVKASTSKEPSNQAPLDGKTAKALYDHLKSKGWQLSEAIATPIPTFDSEETIGCGRPDRVGFVIMRFDSLDTAQTKFPTIDRIYRDKFGRAVTAKNFIIAIMGGQKRINQPDFNQLSEQEYAKLEENLVEFCNL